MNSKPPPAPTPSRWDRLHRNTRARVALGRAGCGMPTKANLAFQAAHAGARDAVHAVLNVDALRAGLASRGWQSLAIESAAADRDVYLKHPELGRTLSAKSKNELSVPMVTPDVAIVIGDGLSGLAVERNAVAVLAALMPRLKEAGLKVGPIIVARQARVALADQVGEIMQARLAIMVIGERPGLSAVDSLGMYLTYAPRSGRLDSERQCISNIHAGGLSAMAAAKQAAELVKLMLLHRCSGVALSGKIRSAETAPSHIGVSKK